jgi:hypothetical protein
MIRGTVEALDLVQLLQLIHESGGTGELRIWNSEIKQKLYFSEGNIILTSGDGRAVDPKQFEEDLYELLFNERGSYLYRTLKVLDVKEGVANLDTPTILVEASRRKDEMERIDRLLPTTKAILLPATKTAHEVVHKRMADLGVKTKFKFGKLSVEEMCLRVSKRFEVLRELTAFCEEKVLKALPINQIEAQIANRLNGKPRRSAIRLFEWMHEVTELAQKAQSFDHVLLRKHWLRVGGFSCRTPGPRALHLLSRLLRYKDDFEFSARGSDSALCVSVKDNLLLLYFRGTFDFKGVIERIREQSILTVAQLAEAAEIAEDFACQTEDLLVDRGFLDAKEWLRLRLDQFLDVCFSIFTWRRPLIRISTEQSETVRFQTDSETRSIILPFDGELRKQLRLGLMRWKLFRQVVPSMDAIFKCAQPTPAGLVKRAHDHLDGRRRVSDLLAMSRATGQELLQFIYRALKDKRLRPLTREEHTALLEQAHNENRPAEVLAAYESALAFGYTDFKDSQPIFQAVEKAKAEEGKLSGVVSIMEGQLKRFHLAAIIQLLLRSGCDGTLRIIQIDQGERIVHIVDGGLYVLFSPEHRGESLAPNEFLTESTEDLLVTLRKAFDNDSPERLEEFKKTVQEEILEALFWEDATFEFARNFIPSEFYSNSKEVTKIRLQEERLLFEAMRRMAEWDQLREVLRSTRARFQFITPEAKMEAYKTYGEFVYFIDGQRSLGELVRLSAVPRLTLYRNLFSMIEDNLISLKDLEPARQLKSATERIPWDLTL